MKIDRLLNLAVIPLTGGETGVSGTYSFDDMGWLETTELISDGKLFVDYVIAQKAEPYEVDGERDLASFDGESDVFDLKEGTLILVDGKCTRQ